MEKRIPEYDEFLKEMIINCAETRRKRLKLSLKDSAKWITDIALDYLTNPNEKSLSTNSTKNLSCEMVPPLLWTPPKQKLGSMHPFCETLQLMEKTGNTGKFSSNRKSKLAESDRPSEEEQMEESLDGPSGYPKTGVTDDPKVAEAVKLERLSAGIIDRFPVSGQTQTPSEKLFERVLKDIKNWGKGYSQSEHTCLLHLKNTRKQGYAHNKRLFWDEHLAGTPDAVYINKDEQVVEVAEFKHVKNESGNQKQKKDRERLAVCQLHVQMAVTGAIRGVLVFHYQHKKDLEVIVVEKDRKILESIYNGRLIAFEKMMKDMSHNPQKKSKILESLEISIAEKAVGRKTEHT